MTKFCISQQLTHGWASDPPKMDTINLVMVGAKIGPNFLVLDYQIDSVHFLGGSEANPRVSWWRIQKLRIF